MKKLVSFGFHAVIMLLLNSMFSVPFEGIASAQTDSVPRLAVSDEKFSSNQPRINSHYIGLVTYLSSRHPKQKSLSLWNRP